MSGIYGYTGQVAFPGVVAAMAAALRINSAAATHAASGRNVSLGAVGLGKQAAVFSDDTLQVAVYSTHALGLSGEHSDNAAQWLADAYRRDGRALLPKLRGGFALAIADARDDSVLLAVDKMGICPLAWIVTGDDVVFGSSLDAIIAHQAVNAEIEPQALYDYLFFHVIPGPRTIYRGVSRLLPGHALRFHHGAVEATRYFAPVFEERHGRSSAELAKEFRAVLKDSVARACAVDATGTFLSGGTDSSTITGMLTRQLGGSTRAYSIGFAVDAYDEMSYARIAARHFGAEHHEYYVTPSDVVTAIPMIARAFDQPFGNASAVPAYFCAKMAREQGTQRILAGDGGDELFGGNDRYATQYILSLYERIPIALRQKVLQPVVANLPAGRRLMPVRKLYRYVEQAMVPMPDRLEEYNLLERLGPATVLSERFLQSVDTQAPRDLLREIYGGVQAHSLVNRMLGLDFRITLFDSDLPKVNGACDLAGIEVAYPLLDDDLLAFSLQLRPGLKLRGTKLRYFFKEALRGFLPDEVLSKRKHGFGLPFGVWLQTDRQLKALAFDSLSDLGRRNIVKPEFISTLLGDRVEEHAAYYGTMVWILVMLEQWFRGREDATRQPRPAHARTEA